MSEHTIFLIGCGAFIYAVGMLGGMFLGYRDGIRDTERRWSEAVARANYQREMERAKQS